MFQNLRVYKCGNFYKYISLPIKCENIEKSNIKKDISNEDYRRKLNNLIRCKTSISDLLLCNDFKFFVTITFSNKYDRFNLNQLRKSISNKIRKCRLHFPDLKFDYLLIPEKHKDGAWHLHGFLSNDFIYFTYISKNGKYLQCDLLDSFGFNNVEILYSSQVIGYVTKYITKDFENREKGKHLYFATQKLKRPDLILNIPYDNPTFDKNFFDYKNDYCYMKVDNTLHNLKMLQ